MFENIEHIKENYKDLEKKMIDPEVLADISRLTKITREYNSLKPIVEKYDQIKDAESTIEENKELINEADDQDMIDMLKEEIKENEKLLDQYNEEMKILLIPKDPNDSRDVIVEIRPGAGGDEAGLFAGDLYRMYHMYADKEGYKLSLIHI